MHGGVFLHPEKEGAWALWWARVQGGAPSQLCLHLPSFRMLWWDFSASWDLLLVCAPAWDLPPHPGDHCTSPENSQPCRVALPFPAQLCPPGDVRGVFEARGGGDSPLLVHW